MKTRLAHANRIADDARSGSSTRTATGDVAASTRRSRAASAGDESLAGRWSRRALTVPAYLTAAVVAVVLLPLAVIVTLTLDARELRRAPRTRFAVGITFVLLCEAAGMLGALASWLLSGGPFGRGSRAAERLDRALQRWWAGALFHRGRKLLGLGLRVTVDPAALDDGPVLVLARHASLVDSLLPCVLLDRLRLRYVLKRELLWDPCLDIVGTRLPNAFVRRGERKHGARHPSARDDFGAADGADDCGEIARVAALASDLEPDEGVVLFPEGTRFTPARRQHLIDQLDERGEAPRLREAGSLRHVLPPRRGGVLALLDAAPDADVVVLAHTGLERAARLGDLWRGSLVGGTIEVELWRVPRREIPIDAAGREEWLAGCWRRLDDWIERRRAAATGGDGRR